MSTNPRYYHQFVIAFSWVGVWEKELICIVDDREILPISLLVETVKNTCDKKWTWVIDSHVVLLNE